MGVEYSMASAQVPHRADMESSFEYTEKSVSREEAVLHFGDALGGPHLLHRRYLA
jgi:hypothetical protein